MKYLNVLMIVNLLVCGSVHAADSPAGSAPECAGKPRSNLVVNVRDKGALGNGVANDSAAFQAAADQIAGTGGVVIIPDGNYMVDAVKGIKIGSDTTVRLSKGAVIKAIPNDKIGYSIFTLSKVSNVTITGGTLVGERSQHKGTAGQWGTGIRVDANNVVIEGLTVKDSWGDGFYVFGQSRNIKFCSVTADNNRRQGISVVSVDGLIIQNSTFSNTAGVGPESGIDLEPNENDTIKNVQILKSKFLNNKGHGIVAVVTSRMKNAHIENMRIEDNLVANNKKIGIGIYKSSGNRVVNNVVKDNSGVGILLHRTTSQNLVTGNRVTGHGGGIRDDGHNNLRDNVLQ